jgi:hypothetical protein
VKAKLLRRQKSTSEIENRIEQEEESEYCCPPTHTRISCGFEILIFTQSRPNALWLRSVSPIMSFFEQILRQFSFLLTKKKDFFPAR